MKFIFVVNFVSIFINSLNIVYCLLLILLFGVNLNICVFFIV